MNNVNKRYLIIDISGVLILHDRWGNSKTNSELIEYLIAQKERFSCVILTNNPPEIQAHIESVYHVPKFYDQFISSDTYKLSKTDPKLYHEVLAVLLATPEQCIFVDDTSANVQAAADAGLTGIVYTTFEEFKKDLQKIIPVVIDKKFYKEDS